MRVLGLDPGTATTGYGVVEGKGNRLVHLAHGTIDTPPGEHFAQRLLHIHTETRKLIAQWRPEAVAIERLYFKQNITTGIAVAQARGVLALAVAQADLPIAEYGPAEAKLAVTGYGKADKRQVQDMIKMLLNLDARPRPDDAADALGLAICLVQSGVLPLHDRGE
jgi:crossover junction endodeoxyribonuclease RuvC